MNTVLDIANQLRACNFEHVRAVIEPDDVMVLIDYLEGQGFLSEEAQAALNAEADIAAALLVAKDQANTAKAASMETKSSAIKKGGK